MKSYDHKKIEKKWQKKWKDDNANSIDKGDTKKQKFYLLDMFPYPSGDGLHMGHTEAYTANDIFSRYKKARGFNVMHPTGFDSFGLPAENYAIKTGTHPKETTEQNTKNFERQLNSLGIDYDYSESINTSYPDYYKWTQWIFARFFENGLVYQETTTVNWCNSCKTVLANEQVEAGACERCKNEVVMKEVPSWFFKITDFADDLIEGLDKVDWPEHTKKNQINWIGKSEGAELEFEIEGFGEKVKVFTTRPDTLFGATYLILSPEHKLVEELKESITNLDEVEKYVADAAKKTEIERTAEVKDKTGVKLEGITAINPATKEEIPVFIADYVLADYGTGAIMAVPAHDERDYEFAKKFGLEIREVIIPERIDKRNPPVDDKHKIERRNVHVIVRNPKDDRVIVLKWKKHSWNTFPMGGIEDGEDVIEAARREVIEETGYKNLTNGVVHGGEVRAEYFAAHKDVNRVSYTTLVTFDLKDEERDSIAPEEDEAHEVTWMDMEDLTLDFMTHAEMDIWHDRLLNGVSAYTGDGVLVSSGDFSNLPSVEARKKITEFVGGEMTSTYRLRDWSVSRQRYWGTPIPIVYDPDGKAHVVPDEHLPWILPEDVDFVPKGEAPLAQSKELKERTEKIFGKGWTAEADTMDTFVDSSWYFLRYPDSHNEREFCSKEQLEHWLPVDLYVGGSEHTYLHLMYARFFTRAMHKIGLLNFDEPFSKLRHQGMVLDQEGVKMSKSKGNIVSPDDVVEKFGADAVRLYMMFAAPLADDVLWDENGIVGTYRFLERAVGIQAHLGDGNDRTQREINKLIKKVGEDIEAQKFNTAISAMMIFVNVVNEEKTISKEEFTLFVQVLAPFAPHLSEELWSATSDVAESVHIQDWPEYDESKIVEDKVTLAVQVNGKVRGEIGVDMNASQDDIEGPAKEAISKWLDGVEIKKTIYVPNRLINFVL